MVVVNLGFTPQGKVAFHQTPYLPAEKRGEFRAVGTLPIVRVFVKLRLVRAIRLFRPYMGERVAQNRGMDSQGRDRGSLSWVALFGHLSLDRERKVQRKNSPINSNLQRTEIAYSTFTVK